MDMQIVYYVLAVLLVLVGLVGTVFPALPGLPLIFCGMVLGAWAGHFTHIGMVTLVILGVLTLVAMGMEFWASALGAKRVGASKQAVLGASIGAFAGIFLGPWGLLVGPFAGAMAGELMHQRGLGQAARVGVGAWMGLLFGVVLKLALAFTMIGLFAFAWFI